MADPAAALAARLQAAMGAAFGPEHASADPVLRRSDRADYQANGAMALAKALGGRNPREVAAAIVEHLDVAGICREVEVAGPGFLNLTLDDSYLGAQVQELGGDERLGVTPDPATETVVVDYSAPNVAKEMHVGHLRSTIIGDALVRVLEFLGHRVIRQNHVGDWGTPFGMLIEHLLDLGEEEAAAELTLGDLNAFYQQARAKFDGDEVFADRARQRVVLLQGGDEKTLDLWRLLVDLSARYFQAVYDRLGVLLTPDDLAGESMYNPMLAEVVADLEARGLAVVDDGALCLFPAGFAGREGEPLPLILRKQDGGYGYATTDMAAVRYRTQQLGATRIVYVVGSPQQQHLAMVYEAARMAGWLVPPARAEHVAFGSVLGADRKMLKTRSGETVKLIALLDEAVERAAATVAEKNPDLGEAERAEVARMVGIGAVKYADLANDRVKDYVFDFDRMLAFEGNTGPYLQYAHARIHSIFRRGEVTPADVAGAPITVAEPAERALALQLLAFGDAVRATAASTQPHRLTGYLFDLASAFTGFFEHCPVLKAPSPELRQSRLALCAITAHTLATGLNLIGIEAPTRM